MSILNLFYEAVKKLVDESNSRGVPVPLIRDPKTGMGSVSLTLVFLSFNVVLAGLIGKITKFLGDVDMTNSLWLFGICTSLYFGRTFSKSKDGEIKLTIEKEEKNE